MKKICFIYAFLMLNSILFAQDAVEDLTHNNTSSQTSSGSQVYVSSRIDCRYTYDADASSEARLNANNNNETCKVSKKGSKVNVSSAESTNNAFANAYDQFLAKATKAFQDKKYNLCIDLCDNMLNINRNGSEAYFLKGAVNYALDKKEIGIQFFKIAEGFGNKDAQKVLKLIEKS